jgi:thiol:disulfide interchange protein DsbD
MRTVSTLVFVWVVFGLGFSVEPAGAADTRADWQGVFDGGPPRVSARLLVHPDDLGSDRVRAGVRFDLDPGWHIYWLRPGDTGLPTTLNWHVEGGSAGAAVWPPPERFREDSFETRGYSGSVLLSTVIERTSDRALGTAHVDVELLACRSECVPASFSLASSLADGDEHAAAVRQSFAALVAHPLPPGSSQRGSSQQGSRVQVPRAAAGAAAIGLLSALALALLGGLVLNAMPCVLPVLAMKLISLAELSRHSRSEMLRHAAAYSAGALATMMLLAVVVVALRSAGLAVGWGFQFQEPAFLIGLCVLLVGFAANLLGAFEFSVHFGRVGEFGTQATGVRRSFFDGLLVVLLGTPCSAPFLGTAVGFAAASSTPVVFAVFAAIGLGLTAPHWVVAVVPAATKWIPRGGAWMAHLRTALGFGLLATVVWLLAILARSVSADALVAALTLLVAVAAFARLFGLFQEAGRSRGGLVLAFTLTVVALVLLRPAADFSVTRAESAPEQPPAFDAAGVRAELEDGRAVFVYFTADWCITCKVNERVVLSRDRVRDAIEELDVAVFRADWTRRDESIRAELAKHGRAGVPFYLVYRPGAPDDPQPLPELLTVNLVVDALRDAARETHSADLI